MNNKTAVCRSIVETSSPVTITFLFVVILFMLVIGTVGTFVFDSNVLSTLVAGILFLIAFTITIIFRQVVMEIAEDEISLCWGTEKVWITQAEISSIEKLEVTFRRRLIKLVSLGPWSAFGKEDIHYFGGKPPLILIKCKDGRNFAVSVDDPEEIISTLQQPVENP